MLEFDDKVVIVTGAASGIGAACARAFGEAGAIVVLADIDRQANELQTLALGDRAMGVTCNIASDDDCRRLVDAAMDAYGRIDVLVNNAGIVAKGTILDLDASDWDRVMDVNLRAYFIMTQLVARTMVDAGRPGAIVNMSSVNAELAIPDILAYVVSKGGVQQLTRASALGLASYGVRVNAIGPGSIMTDLLEQVMANDPEARQRILSRTPMGRPGDPAEVAQIALFLASEMASYVTGQTIFPDGGRMALNYTVPVAEPD